MTTAGRAPTRLDFAAYFLRLGLVGFGGPAALADRMRADLVDRREWITRDEFELALAVAAACPGPLAYQLAVCCGYFRHGVPGALLVGVTFALAPFLLVVGAAAGYAHWESSLLARGLFYGAGPVVVALIGRACWNLGRSSMPRARLAWAIAAAGFALTWWNEREPTWLFLMAAATGAWRLGPPGARPGAPATAAGIAPTGLARAMIVPLLPAAAGGINTQLFAFFFKTGCLVFGSGLVIVPFLQTAVVDGYGWLTPRQFLDSVTVGLVSPGPVVITATFVGYLVSGFIGAAAATTGMFLPAVLFTIVATPVFMRHRHHPRLAGMVRGITAAVVGVLAGTVPLVARNAVVDPATAAILIVSAVLVWRRVLPEPLLVILGAGAGVAIMAARTP